MIGDIQQAFVESFADYWYLLGAALLAATVASYFHITEGLVTTEAEKFYAIIFGVAAVILLGSVLRRVSGTDEV